MGTSAPYFSQSKTLAGLWYGILIGPIAFLTSLATGYALVDAACSSGHTWTIHAAHVGALCLALSGGVVAWRVWNRTGRGSPNEKGDAVARSNLMAVGGILSAGFSLFLLLGQMLPTFYVNPCLR